MVTPNECMFLLLLIIFIVHFIINLINIISNAVDITADGKKIATASSDNSIKIWNADSLVIINNNCFTLLNFE